MKRRVTTALTAIAILLNVSPALAQETEGERLFRQGRAAMLDGRFDEACSMLSGSQRLEPHVGTLLNLAACDERRGHYGSAWVEYQKVLTAARAEGQADRVQLAEQRIAAIEPRVPWLRISPPPSSGNGDLTITLDGGDIVRPAWGTEMPVDPGPHVVTAMRDGKRVFEERIDIREGEHRTIAVALPPSAEVPEGPPPPEHVIVEPKASTDAPATKTLGRWVIEPGLFLGYMGGSVSYPRVSDASGANVTLERVPARTGEQPTSCASQQCLLEGFDGGNVIVGLSLFGGYAVSAHIALGLRSLGAPAISGGGFFGFGPSVVLRASATLSIGAFGVFGDASISGSTNVRAPSGFRQSDGSTTVKAEGSLGGAPGFGLDASLKIADLQRGSLAVTAMPLFLTGSRGDAFALPLGIAYRFQ